MINVVTWIIVGLCVVVIVVWTAMPRWRRFVELHSPVLNVVAALVALTAFIQIHLSVVQFKQTQEAAKKEEKRRFDARMATLVAEVWGNLQVCDYILKGKDEFLAAKMLPLNQFQYDILQDMFRSGDLTKHTVRGRLSSIYHRMLLANHVMDVSFTLMSQKTLASPSQYPMMDERLRQNMSILVNDAADIKKRLEELHSDFKEFWDDPEKYKESIYLKGY